MPELPRLSRDLLRQPQFPLKDGVATPAVGAVDLPERIVQFGSGRFVRGFIEYFIDRANQQGLFGGRVVVVQSTGTGRSNTLDEQDGLFTLAVQGVEQGRTIESYAIISSISRAISANEAWQDVLACARNADVACVISNTTEVGIQLDAGDRIDLDPPRSFPGKLTAFLYERARTFSFAPEAGLVVLPCELIEQNGDVLRDLVVDLARRWDLGPEFIEWLTVHNRFCNTLVDRIVTGTPSEEALRGHWNALGYEDHLLTVAEAYRLWAIEADEGLVQRLPFLKADEGIIVTDDITPYRQLKVRILNGTHTIMVPLSYLSGNDTVLQSMEDPLVSEFIQEVALKEIVPSLDVPADRARSFAEEVLDRFRNPFIEHLLLTITFQHTTKMRHRIVPSILGYYDEKGHLPRRILLGFAAYLLFMRGVSWEDGTIFGVRGGERYPINDDRADYFYDLWSGVDLEDRRQLGELVARVCRDEAVWGVDLAAIPGLVDTVSTYLVQIIASGPREVLQQVEGAAAR